MEKILITGGLGNIGLGVAKKLAQFGHEIVIYDYREDHTIDSTLDDHIKVVSGDIRDYDHLRRVMIGSSGIIHLAAVSRVVWGYENPHECIDVNITGTANVLEGARVSVRKPWVLFGSSREVYGEASELPCKESAQKIVANVYGVTKIAGENLLEQYHKNYGLSGLIMRFSNVYGSKNDQLDRVIPKFIIRASKNWPLVIQGGQQIFDFTHIDDTVEGIVSGVRYLSNKGEQEIPVFDDFHILTGKPTTLQQLCEHIDDLFKNNLEISYAPARSYDVEKFYGDPSKSETVLNFKAKIDLVTGLKMITNELRDHLGTENLLK